MHIDFLSFAEGGFVLRKKPLERQSSAYSHSGTAVALAPAIAAQALFRVRRAMCISIEGRAQ
jgi:hypothetical protein